MSKRNGIVCYSDFYCLNCGSRLTLSRKTNSQREKYHIKDIFCCKCNDTTPHIEVRANDYAEEVLGYYKEHKEEFLINK